MKDNGRAAIFIDGAYLNKLLENDFNRAKIDYGLLADKMSCGMDVLRTYYYNCPPFSGQPPTPDETSRLKLSETFFSALRRLPKFEVCLGRLSFRGMDRDNRPIYIQKQVDIMLAIDLVQLATSKQISHAAILTGDSDFVPAVVAAKKNGVSVGLWYSARSIVHAGLWDVCDERFEINHKVVEQLLK